MMMNLAIALCLVGIPVGMLVVSARMTNKRGRRAVLPFLIRRIAWLILTTVVVFTISFFLMRATPGGPFEDDRQLLPAVKANLEARFGLDRPIHEQYLAALAGLPTIDFGPSLALRDWDVQDVITEGLWPSVLLGLGALLWALLLGMPAGLISALNRGTKVDAALTTLASLGMAVPNFVLAGLLLVPFAFAWKILPPAGLNSPEDLLLPTLSLGAPFAAQVARLYRTGMLEVLGSDWIRTAHAKGLPSHQVLRRHATRVAILPVVTFLGPAMAGILTGSLVIEQVFAIPGIGTHFVQSALNRDYTLALGLVTMFTVLICFLNTLTDLLCGMLDPRVELS